MGEKQDLTLEQLQGQLHNLEERMSAHEKEYAGSFISLELAVLGVIRAIVRTQKERQFLENALQELLSIDKELFKDEQTIKAGAAVRDLFLQIVKTLKVSDDPPAPPPPLPSSRPHS